MRFTQNAIAPLLVLSLASLAYARVPARDAASNLNGGFPAVAQQDDAKPQQDDTKPKQDNNAKPAKPARDAKAPRTDNQGRPVKQQPADKDQKRDNDQAKMGQKQDNKQGGQHGRIKDEDYRTHFGQTHHFSVRTVVTTTTVVPNQTRFVYGGYNFVFVDAWPAGWALGDDCYIDYIDGGYYIIDLAHPGMRVALMIAD